MTVRPLLAHADRVLRRRAAIRSLRNRHLAPARKNQSCGQTPSLRTLSDADKQAKVEKWRQEVKDGIDRILDRQQRERLMSLRVQYDGTIILTESEMATELRLTEEQTRRIRKVADSYWGGLNETLTSSRGTDDEQLEKLAKYTEGFSKMMLEVLTPQQRRRFDALKGKDFDFDTLASQRSGPRGRVPASPPNGSRRAGND